jgi:hypothetical protein
MVYWSVNIYGKHKVQGSVLSKDYNFSLEMLIVKPITGIKLYLIIG